MVEKHNSRIAVRAKMTLLEGKVKIVGDMKASMGSKEGARI